MEVRIKREKEWYNKNFEYEILFGEDERIELSSGQEKVVTLDLPITIQAKLWWCGSRKIEITEKDPVKEISVQANRSTHALPVFILPALFLACMALNSLLPEFQVYIIGTLTGAMALCLGLLTVWRRKWLTIKVS